MVSFEVDDIFLKEIDLMIKVNGKYVSRSEFIKDSLRKNYSVRREFFNTEVLFEKEDSQLVNILSEMGFKADKI